ncbi:hypothetical protein TorRG33x02_219690, partial [Trema orientale]
FLSLGNSQTHANELISSFEPVVRAPPRCSEKVKRVETTKAGREGSAKVLPHFGTNIAALLAII